MRSSDSFFRSLRPYQDQDVLNALDKHTRLLEDENQNFSNVLDAMERSILTNSKEIQDASKKISEKIERQANLDRKEQENQHRESLFQMQEVAFGISQLNDTFRVSGEMIAEQVRQSGIDIVREIEKTNAKLYSIDNNLLNINNSLQAIGSVLVTLLEKIKRPNEVQAIELADQARINIAIGDIDKSLEVTRKAMELCSTSITANAYHLMTLALFDDEKLRNESREHFKKFVKLVGFKLSEVKMGREKQSTHSEIYHTIYSTIFALSSTLGGKILDDTQILFSHISKDSELSKIFFIDPLKNNSTLQKTLFPSPVRELIWSIILQQLIVNKQYNFLVPYILKVTENKIMLKNELIALANEELYSSGLLGKILNKTWQEDTATNEEIDCLNIFCSFQPQNNFNIDDRNLLLLDRYINKQKMPINSSLQEIL